MRCPSCNHPMSMNRYEPGKYKSFECSQCRTTKKRRLDNYDGRIVISPKVPVTHQERE